MMYSRGIEECIHSIFAGVLIGAIREDNEEKANILKSYQLNKTRFLTNFPSCVFQDEYAIFYEIISKLNAKFFSVNELNTIIDNNRDLILDSPYVDLSKLSSTENGMQSTDDEKIEAIKANMREMLVELSNEYVSEDEFNSACEIFINFYKKQSLLETAQNMTRILSDSGYSERLPGKRAKSYSGYDDCIDFYNSNVKKLKELASDEQLRTLVIGEDWLKEEIELDNSKATDSNKLMQTGIMEIDSVMGDLRRGNMLGILGPPKGGKTRFTNYLVSKALHSGLNVCIWSLEGTKEEWIATQLACMIRQEPDFGNVSYNSKDILQRNYGVRKFKSADGSDKDFDREIILAAKTKFATDPARGRLSFIESTAYVEDFLDVLQSHYENENPFDVIVIDQLIDVLSRTGKGKVERISQAYQELKAFITTKMKRPVLAIIPSQLKQSTVDFLRLHPEETIDVTAGGESSETIRTPDDVIGLFSSKEERSANIMHIYSVASRHSSNFPDFRIQADLQCCYFESNPELNN